MINIRLQETTVKVGQRIYGQFSWMGGQETPKVINVSVGWRTEGRGDVDSEVVYENSFADTTYSTFECQIPITGPVSYDGQLLSVIWEVTVTAELPRMFKSHKKKQSKMFQVVPRQSNS